MTCIDVCVSVCLCACVLSFIFFQIFIQMHTNNNPIWTAYEQGQFQIGQIEEGIKGSD